MLTPELLGLKDDPEGKKPINVFEISLVGTATDEGLGLLDIFDPKNDVGKEKLRIIRKELAEEINHASLEEGVRRKLSYLFLADLTGCLETDAYERIKELNLPEISIYFKQRQESYLPNITSDRDVEDLYLLKSLYPAEFNTFMSQEDVERECKVWANYFKIREHAIYILTLATLMSGKQLLDTEQSENLRTELTKFIETGLLGIGSSITVAGKRIILIALFAQKVLFPKDFEKNDLQEMYQGYSIKVYLNDVDFESPEGIRSFLMHSSLAESHNDGVSNKIPPLPEIRKF